MGRPLNSRNKTNNNCKAAQRLRRKRESQGVYKPRRLAKNNTSGFAGICWHRRRKRYRVVLTIHGVTHRIGSYDDLQTAVSEKANFLLQLPEVTEPRFST